MCTAISESSRIFNISKTQLRKTILVENTKYVEGRWTKEEKMKLYDNICLNDNEINWRKVNPIN
jgi:hypothetical protein